MKIIYAMRDDHGVLAKGTTKEIAEKLGIKQKSVEYYLQPATRNKQKGRRLVEIGRINRKPSERVKIGTAIQIILKKLDLDHKSFGQLTGIHQDTVYQWMVGRSRPSSMTMDKMRSVEAVYKAYPDFFDHPNKFEVGGELIEAEGGIKKRNRKGALTDFDMALIRMIEARYGELSSAPNDDELVQLLHEKTLKKRKRDEFVPINSEKVRRLIEKSGRGIVATSIFMGRSDSWMSETLKRKKARLKDVKRLAHYFDVDEKELLL